MPFLNQRGQAAMGIGDGPGSVDRRVVATPGGGICWLDADRVLLQTRIGGLYVVIAVRVSDGSVEPIDPARGANALAAGGGRWVAWLAGTGLYGSLGMKPRAGLVAAGLDGTLAYCPDYQTGVGLVLVAPDGSTVSVPNALVADRNCQVLGPGTALWFDYDGGLRVVGRAPVRPALKPGRTRLVTVAGADWLVYWAEGVGLVAQLDGASDGYVLEPRPIAFNHDAAAVDGELVVAWSTTQGEGPGDLVKVTVDRSQPRVPLSKSRPPFTEKVDGPINTEEETSMHAKQLDPDVHAIVEALYLANMKLAHGTDDDRRVLQKMICETARARKGKRFGWKSNHGVNIANAKDAIAELPEGAEVTLGQRQPLYIWDLFNGTTRKPNPLPVMSETEHVEQFFVPVEPIDHLASAVPVPDPVKPPVSQPPADLAPLVARLAVVDATLLQIRSDMFQLDERLNALGNEPDDFTSFIDERIAAALASYEVSGKTAVGLGHQHVVKLGITKRK